jgi:hypothetical protein
VAAGFLLVVLLVGVMARQFLHALHDLHGQAWTPQTLPLLLALLPLLLASLLDILIWNRTLGWFTAPLPFRLAAPVYIWSSLARYIPGKVGSLLLRVALASEARRATEPVLAASLVELALRTASALLFFLLALWEWLGVLMKHSRSTEIAVMALIPLVLLCAHPRIMLPVLNWALRKMKRPTLDRGLRYREVLGLFATLLLRWLCFGAGLYLIAMAVHPPLAARFLSLTGMGAGSWALGFIGMSPGGVGIMEGTQYLVLRQILATPYAQSTLIYVLIRLWTLIAEGLWALACSGLWRGRQAMLEADAPAAVPLQEPLAE